MSLTLEFMSEGKVPDIVCNTKKVEVPFTVT